MPSTEPVRFSLVARMWGVEQYLPEFLSSLTAQRPGRYTAEVLFVDDGSPDASGRLAQQWLDGPGGQAGFTGQVIDQANAGPSAAANAGLDAAGGDWISWPDPDDRLDPGYLAAVADFLAERAGSEPAIVDTKLVNLVEATGQVEDNYVYRFKYQRGRRVVALAAEPTTVTGRTNNVFFPLALVRELGVRFDPLVRASEDELFVASFLLRAGAAASARVGLVPDAVYIYRRRASGDSLAARAPSQPDFLTAHVGQVALPLARLGASLNGGRAPRWLANLLIGTEKWTFERELNPATRVDWARVEERRYVRGLRQIVALLEAEHIAGFDMFDYPAAGKEFLLGLRDRRLRVGDAAAAMFGAGLRRLTPWWRRAWRRLPKSIRTRAARLRAGGGAP
ncbi:MAG: glycosyltransferase [Bifidobacteriaceae bacterium]|jgi:glycosyltransferase involved in cell wall biosynthesis|nr:glycosyltransferase [Bifidobacteriaceae bacterium]